MITIPGSLSFAKVVMISSLSAKSAGDASSTHSIKIQSRLQSVSGVCSFYVERNYWGGGGGEEPVALPSPLSNLSFYEEEANGPFAASGHMVQNPPCWRASCPLGHPEQNNFIKTNLHFSLFWMSQCVACSPAWWILYHVTASCKGPIKHSKAGPTHLKGRISRCIKSRTDLVIRGFFKGSDNSRTF